MARQAAGKIAAPPLEADDAEIDLGILNDVIGFRIRRIQNHLSRAFLARAERYGVKPGSFSAMALISANPGISQIALSREIGFDKATVVALIDGLERAGWAERRRPPGDRRRYALYATPKGQDVLSDLRAQAIDAEQPIRGALTAVELEQLFGLLDKIYASCFVDLAT